MAKKNEAPKTKSTKKADIKKNTKKQPNGGVSAKKRKAPKTVQDTIPITGGYKNGIIQTTPGYFSRTYALADVDFKTAGDEEAESMFDIFGELINTFDADTYVQFTIDNTKINRQEFEKNILMKPRGDHLDIYREENNQMLKDKLKEGRSNMKHIKYMTVCMPCDGIDDAIIRFSKLDEEINATIKRISKQETFPLTLEERLNLLYRIMNRDDETPLYQTVKIDGKEAESFNLNWMKKQGLTIKDVIAPMSMEFTSKQAKIGNKYVRTLYLSHLPTRLSTDMIADVIELPIDMVTSVNIQPIEQSKAIRLVQRQLTKAKADKMKAEKQAAKEGYSAETMSEDIKNANEEAQLLLDDITKADQKLFFVSVLIMIYADSVAELDQEQRTVELSVAKHSCKFKTLRLLQEIGFKDSLPLCNAELGIDSLLTTTATSVFLPYTTKEISQVGGFYYGLNAISKNMIFYNRKTAINGNGFVLGTAGTGKSFSAKREMIQAALATDDCIYVVDPQGEYSTLVKYLGGEEIIIKPKSGIYLNPLDMDLEYGDDDDPVVQKSDYICSICEIALSNNKSFSPIHKSIVTRCVTAIYRKYRDYIMQRRADGENITIDRDSMPTLIDLYNELLNQDEDVARDIAFALELYTSGVYDSFSKRTNVRPDNRIISYNLKGMGETMKELGLSVCLNNIWNDIIENHRHGKRTWVYLDEFHLLVNHHHSAQFVLKIYKMARKWGGIPTGITQNVGDLLDKPEGENILNNSTFITMLSQGPTDLGKLAALFDIPDSQLPFITNGGVGRGLYVIDQGATVLPFVDRYPTDTKLYKAMSTKPEDFDEHM